MTSQAPTWAEAGYADIKSVEKRGDNIEVEFINGDLLIVDPPMFGVSTADFTVEFDADEGLSLQVKESSGHVTNLTWTQLRAAHDPAFAQELRRREIEEARRLGLRLRALREDKNLSQRDVAKAVGMSPPQLSKIETGTQDLRVSTVQALLRAMGATFSDISGPGAPEVSQKALRRNAERAGVPTDLLDHFSRRVPRSNFANVLARAFGWTVDALTAGAPTTVMPDVQMAFKKAATTISPENSPLVLLAHNVSQLARAASTAGSYQDLPPDPAVIRERAADSNGHPSLQSLVSWLWGMGVPVIPLRGRGAFSAATWVDGGTPLVVLKESREFAPFWLFDLAHEIGHICFRHVTSGGLVDVDPPTAGRPRVDEHEEQADKFALAILLPDHRALLEAVRREARGSHLRFKNAVLSVASDAGVDAGLLGMVAAYDLTEVGEAKDRWGSATNIARAEGPGLSVVQVAAREHLDPDRLAPPDAWLLQELCLGGTE